MYFHQIAWIRPNLDIIAKKLDLLWSTRKKFSRATTMPKLEVIC